MDSAGYMALGIVGLLFLAYSVYVAVVYGYAFVYSLLVRWGLIQVEVPDLEGAPQGAWPPEPKNRTPRR